MSLDVNLRVERALPSDGGSGIFVREDGTTREVSRAEWNAKFPGVELVEPLDDDGGEVYWANITHNLCDMAEAAGIYKALWRPEEIGISRAVDLIDPLTEGLEKLRADPEKYRAFNAPNNWGKYENLVSFVEQYLAACRKHPTATINVSR